MEGLEINSKDVYELEGQDWINIGVKGTFSPVRCIFRIFIEHYS